MLRYSFIAMVLVATSGTAEAQVATRETPTIAVVGRAEVSAPPDQFKLEATVRGRGRTQVEALRGLADQQRTLSETLPALEGLTRTVVTTGEIRVEPRYDPACTANEYADQRDCAIIGFEAGSSFILLASPAERGGDAVSLAAELGVDRAQLEEYGLADPAALQERANRAAFADAERQARMLADASGRRLLRIQRIQDPRVRFSTAEGFSTDDDDVVVTGSRVRRPTVSVEVAPEPITATSQVTVIYEID